MDLDARLEEPVLVSLDQDGLLQLLEVESGACAGDRPLGLLGLLVVARALLGALRANACEEVDEVVLAEVESHAQAALHEVLLLHASESLRIEDLVGLLD